MRVLIADQLGPQLLRDLSKAGLEVELRPELGPADLPGALSEAHVLVVRSTRVSAAAIAAAPDLELIVRAGAGTDTLDLVAAARRGVYVATCPGKNAVAVAELTFALMLALDRRLPEQVAALRAGQWRKSELGRARGLLGRTLGVVGVGGIGAHVLARGRSFGMRCLAWSRSLTDEAAAAAGAARREHLIDLCAQSDVVSVHVPLTASTRGLIGVAELAAMRPGTHLINTSRASLVDQEALADALARGHVRAAADVHPDEPTAGHAAFDTPLAAQPGFYGTHHVGASTEQAAEAVAAEVARVIVAFATRGDVPNAVNVWHQPPAAGQLRVRHLDRVGVLATVFEQLRAADLNVQDVHNVIFEGGDAACAQSTLDAAPAPALLAQLRARCADVLGVQWRPSDGAPG